MEVWIASHLGDAMREQTLLLAFDSIKNNAQQPDAVWISYSSAIKVNISMWQDRLGQIPLHVLVQPKKTMQFQHFQFIAEQAHESNAIITFLDDDDLVDPLKYATLQNYFDSHPSASVVCHPISRFGKYSYRLVKDVDSIASYEKEANGPNEYFCLAIKFAVVRRWFINRINRQTLRKHKATTDMTFGSRYMRYVKHHKINKVLQYQRVQSIVNHYWP